MKFVIDTNIVLSLFKAESYAAELVNSHTLELFSPRELLKELEKYSETICSKSEITKEEFEYKLLLLPKIIEFISSSEEFKIKASQLISDKKDVPFLALALELSIPIWSNDKHFKEQSELPVFTTSELKKFLDE
jgi:predicted nucleic acid-binding protein